MQQIIFLSASNDWQKPVSSSLILSWHSSRRAADNMITPSCLPRGSQCSFYHDQLVHIQDQRPYELQKSESGKGRCKKKKKTYGRERIDKQRMLYWVQKLFDGSQHVTGYLGASRKSTQGCLPLCESKLRADWTSIIFYPTPREWVGLKPAAAETSG